MARMLAPFTPDAPPHDPSFALVATDQLAPEALHAAFVRAFADYLIGPFNLALDQWSGFVLPQGVDRSLGRAAVDAEGNVLAFALVAPRPALGRWRLGTMGAVPEARGSGAAVQLLLDFIQRGREAGLKALELEVFVQNERAARLYRRHGFVERHALHGWQRVADAGEARPPSPELACTQAEALAWLREAEATIADLPLQVCADVVGVLTAPWTAWRRGRAQLVFTGDRESGVLVRSLIDRHPAQQDAEALVQALLAAYPGAKVSVPQLQRADLGGEALLRCGFATEPLHQALMRLDLAPASSL
jgi:ribosomal protein S18 acetylase RimI-like enzyme